MCVKIKENGKKEFKKEEKASVCKSNRRFIRFMSHTILKESVIAMIIVVCEGKEATKIAI